MADSEILDASLIKAEFKEPSTDLSSLDAQFAAVAALPPFKKTAEVRVKAGKVTVDDKFKTLAPHRNSIAEPLNLPETMGGKLGGEPKTMFTARASDERVADADVPVAVLPAEQPTIGGVTGEPAAPIGSVPGQPVDEDSVAKAGVPSAPTGLAPDQPVTPIGEVTEVAVDIIRLLVESRKITDKVYLVFYKNNRALDPLRTGPMGVNVSTLELNESAVAQNVAPRFMIVMNSFFPDLGPEFTSENLDKWKKTLETITEISQENPSLLADIKEGVDIVVREFASNTFKQLDTLQIICRKTKRYNPKTDIGRSFVHFFEVVDHRIQRIADDHLVLENLTWNVEGPE
jgi:hypothetical protein